MSARREGGSAPGSAGSAAARVELLRALGTLAEPPAGEHRRLAELLDLGAIPAATAHTELFDFALYPYASVYLGAEGMLGGEARDRVAGFWRAIGETPPADCDHLTALLSLYTRLAELEAEAGEQAARQSLRRARTALLWEHLLSWLPVYCRKVAATAPPYYRRWAELLERALVDEADRCETQELLPLHLRAAPPLPDPRDAGAEAFLGGLLAPVRSGAILLRSDLERAARGSGLATRAGERRFLLEALLGQDAAATLRQLAAAAERAAAAHDALPEALGGVRRFWVERARATAALLAELAAAEPAGGGDPEPR